LKQRRPPFSHRDEKFSNYLEIRNKDETSCGVLHTTAQDAARGEIKGCAARGKDDSAP
jgi:hypothetical protein